MKAEENKFAYNRILTNKDQNKNQLTETIFQRQKFKIQELLTEKHNFKRPEESSNEST